MKALPLLIFLLGYQSLLAQNELKTDSFVISGKVRKERTVTAQQLKFYPQILLGEVNTSCSSKQREDAKGVKAVLLKDVLDSVRFDYVSSKMLNQFYFKCEASDGYAVVFSFNEIYNTQTGKNLYLITEKDGKDISEMDNRILMLCPNDLKPGSRNLKGLTKIKVCQAE